MHFSQTQHSIFYASLYFVASLSVCGEAFVENVCEERLFYDQAEGLWQGWESETNDGHTVTNFHTKFSLP
jgi:hypothetical protein